MLGQRKEGEEGRKGRGEGKGGGKEGWEDEGGEVRWRGEGDECEKEEKRRWTGKRREQRRNREGGEKCGRGRVGEGGGWGSNMR